MKQTIVKPFSEIILYKTETEMLRKLESYCIFWYENDRLTFRDIKKYLERDKPVYKFNKSKAKKILQKNFLKAKCWSNHCYLEEDFELFTEMYLKE